MQCQLLQYLLLNFILIQGNHDDNIIFPISPYFASVIVPVKAQLTVFQRFCHLGGLYNCGSTNDHITEALQIVSIAATQVHVFLFKSHENRTHTQLSLSEMFVSICTVEVDITANLLRDSQLRIS